MATAPQANGRLTRGHWLVLTAALLGWMFDGVEQGLFPLVGRPAIADLFGYGEKPLPEQEAAIGNWIGIVTATYLVGAATGGVLFGWLGDRIGRVRAMTLSVFTYAIFTGLCGFAQAAWQIGVLRFIASLGMGGEWALGVSLVMEVWPNQSRALLAGLIGAAANVGYLIDAIVGKSALNHLDEINTWLQRMGLSPGWADALTAHRGWRLMMVAGTAPALLTLLIRLFVPESERWQEEHGHGRTSHWATRDLFGVLIGSLGPGLIIVLWASDENPLSWRLTGTLAGVMLAVFGYSYPVVRYLKREAAASGRATADSGQTIGRMLLAAALAGTALLGTWAAAQWAPTWADMMSHQAKGAKEQTQMCSAIGAIVGTIGAALLGNWLGRRITYALLCVLSIGSLVWLYQFNPVFGKSFLFGTFAVGVCTASFYGWLPLYLPELFRTGVRATCQGFGYNFGRILAAIGALQTGNLIDQFKDDHIFFGVKLTGGYPLACTSMSLIYLVGLTLIWFAPETRGKPLPE
ncbi:MAG TPA: MFS transporter [Pirellulales bacterium]|nr:MFS transporter [Pirellulales bacterium]